MRERRAAWPGVVVAALLVMGCEDQPTGSQRHRDNVRCMEFASGVPADRSEVAYKRCMDGGPGRFTVPEDTATPEDTRKSN